MTVKHWEVTTAATAAPVTLEEAKTQLAIPTAVTDHDAHVTQLILAATEIVEEDANRAFVTQTVTEKLYGFPCGEREIVVARGPLASVTAIQYVDTDGATQSFTDYVADTTHQPGRIILNYNTFWAQTRDIQNSVVLTYISGVAVASVPKIAKQAILLMVAHMFDMKELVNFNSNMMGQTYEVLVNRLKFGDYP